MRKGFSLGAMFHAVVAAIGFGSALPRQRLEPVSPMMGGVDYSKPRSGVKGNAGHHSARVAKRRRRNEIAFESRRRNRAA